MDTNTEPVAERLRRERVREASSGITSFSIDREGALTAFALAGDVYAVNVDYPAHPMFRQVGGASDVRVASDGKALCYVAGRELYRAGVDASGIGTPVRISPSATATASWGLPDFIAAEEMRRYQGYWWSPNSQSILIAGVQEDGVPVWHIANPVHPEQKPADIRYPAAGSANAVTSLVLWSSQRDLLEIKWDQKQYPYLAVVSWKGQNPTIAVQSRDQREVVLLGVDTQTGLTDPIYAKRDKLWVELIPGVPTWSERDEIIDITEEEMRRLRVGHTVVSKADWQVRKYVGELAYGGFVYVGSRDAKDSHVWLASGKKHFQLSRGAGVFDAVVGGDTIVIFGSTLGRRPLVNQVLIVNGGGAAAQTSIPSISKGLRIDPRPNFHKTDNRGVEYALLLPKHRNPNRKLPILLDPYGGPMAQRCVSSSLSFTTSQWFANQGFAVLVGDGRGTPGRGRKWEKAVANNLLRPALEDQVEILDHALKTHRFLDRSKVAIRGWSFGGYLSAAAVLLRPDKFHAAIAGAPVTDWRYYDTHYTERYLGLPDDNSRVYDQCSLLSHAAKLCRPLLLIHGMNDDNVVVAHSLLLSEALFKAGRSHVFLPLSGITHMASSETAAESLLHAQIDFLKSSLQM